MDDDRIEKVRVTTRGYEMSSEGVIPVASFLRYLEHVRWSTISRSSKLPLRQFFVLGVVRSQTLELHRQIAFDVELEISMWVSRIGKTSIEYSHDIVRISDGDLVGRSTATIVALDIERRPAPISDDARVYLVERTAIAPERLGAAVPADAWQRGIELRPSDQDLQQHVNHARYAELADDTRTFYAKAGDGDSGRAVKRFTIAYEHEARLGDSVLGKMWRAKDRDGAVDFALVKTTGELLVRARFDVGSVGIGAR